MLDIGWSELAVVAVLALLVIGPKDLPGVMRTMGKWMQKARSVSREFQSSVDEMIREAELEDAKKALDSAKSLNVDNAIEKTLDPDGEVKESARELDREARSENVDGDSSGAAAAKDSGKNGAAETASEAPAGEPEAEADAKVVTTPTKVAPPHSVTPPPPAEPSAAAPEVAAKPVDGKTASSGGGA